MSKQHGAQQTALKGSYVLRKMKVTFSLSAP